MYVYVNHIECRASRIWNLFRISRSRFPFQENHFWRNLYTVICELQYIFKWRTVNQLHFSGVHQMFCCFHWHIFKKKYRKTQRETRKNSGNPSRKCPGLKILWLAVFTSPTETCKDLNTWCLFLLSSLAIVEGEE